MLYARGEVLGSACANLAWIGVVDLKARGLRSLKPSSLEVGISSSDVGAAGLKADKKAVSVTPSSNMLTFPK